jgi:M6 family metalloprotease-like protein
MLIIICSPIIIVINQPTLAQTAINSLPLENYDTIDQTTTLSVLVVLMEFEDDLHYPLHTVQHYIDLFFSGEPYSIRQYYRNTSYGTVDLTGDILGWFQAEENLAYYGQGGRIPPGQDIQPYILAQEALDHAIDEQKDPRDYDLFVIIHSGDGQEYSGNSNDIWSHQWSVWYDDGYVPYSMNHEYVDYGTPSHELGHALLFPDLYDFRNYEHIFAGPYGMMGRGESHFSIWNKYYSKISSPSSSQFLTADYRLQISNYSEDTTTTINPIGLETPQGVLWLEVGWNSSGYADPNHGSGWTITVREDIDYDNSLPKHGLVVAEIKVGPRNYTQVEESEYPPWNVVDSHPETAENKDDAAFSLASGDIGTFISGEGWAVQILEKFMNLSYQVRITNESNIPQVMVPTTNHSVSGLYNLTFSVGHSNTTSIITEVSIDNGPWTPATPTQDTDVYAYSWDTTQEREGSHIVRARAIDNSTIPYVGYSSFETVNIDNINGSILVVDDDLGRDAEVSVLTTLDNLGLTQEYEVIRTSSFTQAEISAEELALYEKIIWVGNPEISPLSNSHINYEEFKQIRRYLMMDLGENRSPGIIVMSSYTIFDFSNQGADYQNEYQTIFQAQSPINFRSPVSNLIGSLFLERLPSFTLGNTDTLRANRSSDGEVVYLMAGATPILVDSDPQFPGYPTKGYIVDDGQYKLVNYLFQPAMVPSDILLLLLNSSLSYLDQPANGSSITTTTTTTSTPIDPIQILGVALIGGLGISTLVFFFRPKPRKGDSHWLKRDK